MHVTCQMEYLERTLTLVPLTPFVMFELVCILECFDLVLLHKKQQLIP